MRGPTLLLALVLAAGPGPTLAGENLDPAAVRDRVEHHLRQADELSRHFAGVLAGECPRLGGRPEWDAYLDGEVERVVTLVAHVEEAWVEAKRTGDDGVRQEAKAPRRRLERVRQLVDRLGDCARRHGTSVDAGALWQRIEREVPGRQGAIALPR